MSIRISCVQSSLVCLSSPGSVKTNNFTLFIAYLWTACLYPTKTPLVSVSSTEMLIYPLLTASYCSQICCSALISISICNHSWYAASEQTKNNLTETIPLLCDSSYIVQCSECPYLYENRHPVTQWLEDWIFNWWCQARNSAKLDQSNKIFLVCFFLQFG